MVFSKTLRKICLTAVFAVFGTVTAFAADAGQASVSDVNVRAEASTSA